MNSILERVNTVCENVRRLNPTAISFKKLVGSTRKEFKNCNLDIALITKKEKTLSTDEFYVDAYYDPEDDFNQDTSIEVYVHHNFSDTNKFQKNQITDFLIQIYDAVVHELRHQQQSRNRIFETYSDHASDPYSKYLADPDELDAYAFSIAVELLRVMTAQRAKRYMSKMTVLAKMRIGPMLVSPNLGAYVGQFKKNPLLKKLAKKVYKHLETLDKSKIFV
jgi:hypothetical protein